MKEFIERNRKLLEFYCVAARIIGWALMLIPLALIALALLWNQLGGQTRLPPPEISLAHIGYFMLGLIVLGIGQFIRHLFQTESKPGWILRLRSFKVDIISRPGKGMAGSFWLRVLTEEGSEVYCLSF